MATIKIEKCRQQKSHADTVVVVRYSPSGQLLVSIDQGGEIIFWPTGDSRSARRLCSPYVRPTGAWFSEDEEFLLVGHQGGVLLVFSVPKVKLVGDVKLKPNRPEKTNILPGTSRPILDWVVLAISPAHEGTMYVVLEFRDFFKVQMEGLKVINHSHVSGPLVEYAAASLDGQFAFCADELGYIYRLLLPEMKLEPFAIHHELVLAFDSAMHATTKDLRTGIAGLSLSHDNKYIASTSREGGVQVWNIEAERQKCPSALALKPMAAREPLLTVSERRGWIRGVCFIPHSTALVLGGDTGAVEIWDYQSDHVEHTAKCPAGVRSIDVSTDGSQLAIGCEDGGIYIVPWGKPNQRAAGKTGGKWSAGLFNLFGNDK